MTPGGDRDRYLLAVRESERIFRRQIIPSLLRAEPAEGSPVVVLLRGQPGAGKTVLASHLADGMTGRPALADADSFRAFHPAYQQLRAAGDLGADALVQADARRWFEMAIDYLTGLRADMIAEHIVPDRALTRFADNGYQIGAALLAVPQAVSRLRVLERYQRAREVTGAGRHVSPQAHDRRYQDLAVAADTLDSDRRIAAIYIYNRAASAIYRNWRLPAGVWHHEAPARAALEYERGRPWTGAESREFLALHASLATRVSPALAGEVEDALNLARPLLHPDAGPPPGPQRRPSNPGTSSDRPAAALQDPSPGSTGSDHGWLAPADFPLPLAEALRRGPSSEHVRRAPAPGRGRRSPRSAR